MKAFIVLAIIAALAVSAFAYEAKRATHSTFNNIREINVGRFLGASIVFSLCEFFLVLRPCW